MKKNGFSHDSKTKEAIRLMAVQRIREGEDVAFVVLGKESDKHRNLHIHLRGIYDTRRTLY